MPATYTWREIPAPKGATRATPLSATNDVRMRAVPTRGAGDMARRDARAMGAVSAPSVRMGARARARAVRQAPNRWASTGTLNLATLNRRRREAGLTPLKSLPA